MARYIVRAAQIVVEVSDARREVYLLRGTRLPETATEASVARLLDRGLIASKEQPETETPDTPDVPEQPVEPAKAISDMTADELKAHLDARGIPHTSGMRKDDLIALARQ